MARYQLHYSGKSVLLREQVYTIGRESECDLSVDDASISRHHARLWVGESELWIEDLGTPNGVFLNAVRIVKKTKLVPGDTFLVGQTTFHTQFAGTRSPEAVTARTTRPPAHGRPSTPPEAVTEVLQVEPAAILQGLARQALGAGSTPVAERFSAALGFVNQLIQLGLQPEARGLLGEAFDLLVHHRARRVLPLSLVIKARSETARCNADLDDPTWRARLEALLDAEK